MSRVQLKPKTTRDQSQIAPFLLGHALEIIGFFLFFLRIRRFKGQKQKPVLKFSMFLQENPPNFKTSLSLPHASEPKFHLEKIVYVYMHVCMYLSI